MNLDDLPYIESAHYGGYRPPGQISMVVIHTAETGEGSTAAEGVAAYFAGGSVVASSHLTVDDNSAVRCVHDDHVAYTAGEGDANRVGLHVEICGRAGQTAGEWADDYSTAALAITADLCRQWVARYPNLRPVRLSADQLRAGERDGFCGHADYHEAYPTGAYRSDPGVEFPWDHFLALVRGDQPQTQEVDGMYVVYSVREGGIETNPETAIFSAIDGVLRHGNPYTVKGDGTPRAHDVFAVISPEDAEALFAKPSSGGGAAGVPVTYKLTGTAVPQ